MQEARDAREAIVGSFDVLIARGGHRMNEIMKVLTLTSVILLPGALIAGVMGMNFKVGLFDQRRSSGSSWPDRRDGAAHGRARQTPALDLTRTTSDTVDSKCLNRNWFDERAVYRTNVHHV